MVFAGTQQERSDIAAEEPESGDGLRSVAQRQRNRHGGGCEHAHKSEALRYELIESEGGVHREKEDGDAGAGNALGEDLLPFAPQEIGDG